LAYRAGEQRWQHRTEIGRSYGYVEITERQVGFRLTRWLYALCWTGTDRPNILFEPAVTWLMTHNVLRPGCSTLERYIARLRSRVEERLWRSLGRGISGEQQGKLENLLVVPAGSRTSPLDRLRTGPVMVNSRSLLLALMRLTDRAIGGSDHADDQQQCPIYRLHPLFIETAHWFADFGTRQRRKFVHHNLRKRA